MFAFESIVAKNEPETAAFVSIAVKLEPKTAVFASSAVKLEPKRFAADHGSVLQSKKLVTTPSVYLTAKLKPTALRFAKEFARKVIGIYVVFYFYVAISRLLWCQKQANIH